MKAVLVLILIISMSSMGRAAEREACETLLSARGVAGFFADQARIYAYEKASLWRLLADRREGRGLFDRLMWIHARGWVSQGQIERVLLRNWFDLSHEAREDLVLWFARFGDRESVRRLEREITSSNNEYITNTQRYLFESLLEILLRRSSATASQTTKALFKDREPFWLRIYLSNALSRAIQHPEIYGEADLKKREWLFRSLDYNEQRELLVKTLRDARRSGSFDRFKPYLFSGIYGFGEHDRLGANNSSFYGFHDALMEIGFNKQNDPSKEWKNPYIRFLYYLMVVRMNSERLKPEVNVYVDAVSITLNWLLQQPEIWTPGFREEFLKLSVHLSPTILENIENLRPELLPLLTAKTQGEMGQVLDNPGALAPKLLFIEDL